MLERFPIHKNIWGIFGDKNVIWGRREWDFKGLYIPFRVRKSPMIAMTLSLAVSSTCSPSKVLTWESLLKTDSDMSLHRIQVDDEVCSLMKGAAILKIRRG